LREAGYEMELTLRLEIGLRPHAGDDETENGNATLDLTEEDLQVLQRAVTRILLRYFVAAGQCLLTKCRRAKQSSHSH
jgi:hypothetical protein